MRAINSGELTYALSCGGGFYAPTLTALGTAPPLSKEAFISADLGMADTVTKSGYIVNLAPGADTTAVVAAGASCNAAAAAAIPTYFAEVHPVTVGSTGQRSFATDQRGTIFQDNTGATFTLSATTSATTPVQ